MSTGDAGAPLPLEPDPPAGDCATGQGAELIALANQARAEQGTPPLRCDPGLMRAAQLHTDDMCTNDYFSHTSQDGTRFGERIRREGVRFGAGAENIARGSSTAEGSHRQWMNSDGHRRNILNPNLRRIGVGHAPCDGRHFWTQVFTD